MHLIYQYISKRYDMCALFTTITCSFFIVRKFPLLLLGTYKSISAQAWFVSNRHRNGCKVKLSSNDTCSHSADTVSGRMGWNVLPSGGAMMRTCSPGWVKKTPTRRGQSSAPRNGNICRESGKIISAGVSKEDVRDCTSGWWIIL